MIQIDPQDPGKDILPSVLNWMKLLAEGEYEKACTQLDEPNSYGIVWTPEMVLHTLHDTFCPETLFVEEHPEGPQFSDPNLIEQGPIVEVFALDDGTGYACDAPVALNGNWSDLTARLEFLYRAGGFAAVLHDLHVL